MHKKFSNIKIVMLKEFSKDLAYILDQYKQPIKEKVNNA